MNVPLDLRRGCKRVLVLDRDPDVRDALVDLLMTEGYEVAVGGDGEIGLDLVKLFRPDAILLDPRIPGPRTEEFVRRLRSQRENARVRVIVMGESLRPDPPARARPAACAGGAPARAAAAPTSR